MHESKHQPTKKTKQQIHHDEEKQPSTIIHQGKKNAHKKSPPQTQRKNNPCPRENKTRQNHEWHQISRPSNRSQSITRFGSFPRWSFNMATADGRAHCGPQKIFDLDRFVKNHQHKKGRDAETCARNNLALLICAQTHQTLAA